MVKSNLFPENKYFSYNSGSLPEGCQYCVRGEKLVLFATGLCPRDCYFCPISDQKYGHDAAYANEREILSPDLSPEPVIKEARLMQAKGAGITGGDPLMSRKRTVRYIQELKKTFGSSFHLHLYTSLNLATEPALKELAEAGLDEIRFHLDLEDQQFWKNLILAGKFPWKIGVEIPCIPTKIAEMKRVADFIQGQVDFFNLNELERADNRRSQLDLKGMKTIHQFSYAVRGSVDAGKEIMAYVREQKYSYTVHLCTAKLKEKVQLRNRLKLESQQMKRPFDQVNSEGLLIRGALYLPDLSPGISYRQRLKQANKEKFLERLNPLAGKIKQKLNLKEEELIVDSDKLRILLSTSNARRFRKELTKLGLQAALVQETPTADQLEIEVEFI
ncbi:radical SAM protein [Candidatus Woesearchaeota archaeon]|nr:radical SAM protein [Candidatus Woesearchaeota archaeon]